MDEPLIFIFQQHNEIELHLITIIQVFRLAGLTTSEAMAIVEPIRQGLTVVAPIPKIDTATADVFTDLLTRLGLTTTRVTTVIALPSQPTPRPMNTDMDER